jgi:uncharacterized protein with GYD domain
MPTYVIYVDWTDQGLKNAAETVQRAEVFKGLLEKEGGKLREFLWTNGQHDIVVVCDAPDDETVSVIGLKTARLGNVRVCTQRAYGFQEMSKIVKRL